MSAPLAKFSGFFGQPRVGLRKYRILGMSAVDLAVTLAGTVALIHYRTGAYNIPLICYNFVGAVSIGCLVHAVFGVDASLNKFLREFF